MKKFLIATAVLVFIGLCYYLTVENQPLTLTTKVSPTNKIITPQTPRLQNNFEPESDLFMQFVFDGSTLTYRSSEKSKAGKISYLERLHDHLILSFGESLYFEVLDSNEKLQACGIINADRIVFYDVTKSDGSLSGGASKKASTVVALHVPINTDSASVIIYKSSVHRRPPTATDSEYFAIVGKSIGKIDLRKILF